MRDMHQPTVLIRILRCHSFPDRLHFKIDITVSDWRRTSFTLSTTESVDLKRKWNLSLKKLKGKMPLQAILTLKMVR